jgi:hypothetical protein
MTGVDTRPSLLICLKLEQSRPPVWPDGARPQVGAASVQLHLGMTAVQPFYFPTPSDACPIYLSMVGIEFCAAFSGRSSKMPWHHNPWLPGSAAQNIEEGS